jgi:hypothetical protein
MFIATHDRLNVPSSLGLVKTFDKVADPATRVPDVFAFDNDASVGVDLRFDANYDKAFVINSIDVSSGKNVVNAQDDTFKVSIDGETAVTVDITAGTPRTAAQFCADVNAALLAAGGNTAKAKAIVAGNYIKLMSGTTGVGSSVEILTATNACYTVWGWTVGLTTAAESWELNLQGGSAITINAGGMKSWINVRPHATRLRVRGVASVAVQMDATLMYRHSGVQQ